MVKEQESKPVTIDYSTLSKLLPSYDGNKRTLAFYIEGVENALSLIANRDDVSVACLIRNKLIGKAVEALSENPGTNTWDSIKEVLKKKFGEFRTTVQLIQELLNVSRESSSLDALGDRIRYLVNALIAAEPDKRVCYEQMAVETFLDKLHPITAISVKLKFPANLDQAIIFAKQEEIKLRARRAQTNKVGSSKPLIKNKTQNQPFVKKDQSGNPRFSTNKQDLNNKNKLHFQNDLDHEGENDPDPEMDNEETSFEETEQDFLQMMEDLTLT